MCDLIPRPHEHLGDWHEAEDIETEWYCPTQDRWVWCPGPCPDGTEHSEERVTNHGPQMVETIKLL